ncbi:type II toxin-antitoxin system HicB family antitoxin [Nitratireductor sp. CH_MIT9313-5]|uniref:type II toxin-antitoxin system HicB family antitoxin n=1 Tax=Nitratireductor sp. CH_MIT9313-5 TaxID=3107764 RepID=UPI0030095869
MSAIEYRIEIQPLSLEDGGGFVAFAPDLPGCISDGATEHEAIDNLHDAIRDWIECAEQLGRAVPQPTPELMYA